MNSAIESKINRGRRIRLMLTPKPKVFLFAILVLSIVLAGFVVGLLDQGLIK